MSGPASDTARALLSVEQRLHAALATITDATPEQVRRSLPRFTDAIALGRAAGRRAGADRMAAELRASGLSLRIAPLPPLPDTDRHHAEQAAAGMLKALDVLAEKKAAGKAITPRATIAAKVELDATTEAASAFADERQRIETRLVRDEPRVAAVILKRWNAMLDACPVCRGLHNTTRPLGVDFKGGKVPGKAHPRCRCITSYVPIPLLAVGAQHRVPRAEPSWLH